MKKISRFDVLKLDGYEITPQGFMRIPVYAARTGVQVYRKLDDAGKPMLLKEYRPAEEVFSERTMSSLRSCPFTNNHPEEMVNVDNAKDLMCGFTVDHVEKIENRYLKTFVVIYDKKAIEDVKSGKREVSMGYDVELDFTPGEFEGQKYDAIQRNIVHNHIALVDRARGGREIRLRIDHETAMLVNENDNQSWEDSMAKLKIGNKEFEVAQDLSDAFTAHVAELEGKSGKLDSVQSDLTKSNEKVKELETKNAELATEKDSLKAKVDSLEADKAKNAGQNMDSAAVEQAVKERRRIDKVAEKILGAEEFKKADAMTALELKKAVIKAECKDAVLDGQSETYISARFDHIAEQVDTSSNANSSAGAAVSANRKKAGTETKSEADKSREKSMKADADAWKMPVGKQAAKGE